MSNERHPAETEKLNPFYKPRQTFFDRRELLALFGGSVAWAVVAAGSGSFAEGADSSPGGQKPGDQRQGGRGNGGRDGGGRGGEFVLPDTLRDYSEMSVILGRASDTSITASVLAVSGAEGYLEIGTEPGRYTRKTPPAKLPAGEPVEMIIDQLRPNTDYVYRLQYRKPGAAAFTARPECRFATQRSPGARFTFTIQGDSHPERMGKVSHPDLYARTLQLAAADKPDFHICIGDDFSVEHVRTVSHASLAVPYLLQRPFLGLIGQTAPVFLMNGNHEQASLYNYSQTDVRREVAVGTQVARNRLFPTPSARGFYSGDPTPWKDIGELKSYCAWTWGDALFVLLDNYWHSPVLVDTGFQGEDAHPKQGGGEGDREARKGEAGKGDGGKGGPGKGGPDKRGGKGGGQGKGGGKGDRDWWAITLGDAQYHWLKTTLEQSKARYKFVFAHHVLGSGRGGVEEADLYEWGGEGRGGTFAEKRPGWELPIHKLMAKHKVNIFFQGHDHLYCRQEKDGIVYQELPMPSDYTYAALNDDRYTAGKKIPNSGYLRVDVSPEGVTVQYLRTYLEKDETPDKKHGAVADRYTVKSATT